MRDDERPADCEHDAIETAGQNDTDAVAPRDEANEDEPFDESLTDEIAALIDDGRTFAEAEFAFQKTRAAVAGKSIGMAAGFAVVALVALHVTLLALAVGMVIALQPHVSIWGAIAIVVGGLLLVTVLLALAAKRRADHLAILFGSSDSKDDA